MDRDLINHLDEKLGIKTALFVSLHTTQKALRDALIAKCSNRHPVKLSIDAELFLRIFRISNSNLKILRETKGEVGRFKKMEQDFYQQTTKYTSSLMDMTFEFQNWMFNEIIEAQKRLSSKNQFMFVEGPATANEAGHIANMTNQLRMVLSDVRKEAAKYHKEIDSDFRKCPHCGTVWQKTEGCSGTTYCGKRRSSAADVAPKESEKMFTFAFQWDSKRESLSIKQMRLTKKTLSLSEEPKGYGTGCGKTIKWSAMAPANVAVEFKANLHNTKDVSTVPPSVRPVWQRVYNKCMSLLPSLAIRGGTDEWDCTGMPSQSEEALNVSWFSFVFVFV